MKNKELIKRLKNRPSSTYWKKRFELLEQMGHDQASSKIHELEDQYRKAQKTIEGQINSWHQRFANNNEISMAEARKILNAKELDEFKWDVKEYIKYGEQNEVNQLWMKQLENASARFHISRLEALKIQTQNSLEVLFGNKLDVIDSFMKNVYTDGYYHSIYEFQHGFNIGWDIGTIDQNKLEKIISKPWAVDGKNFSSRIWDNKKKLVNEVHTELTQMTILGKAPDEAIKNISRKMNTSKVNSGRLVMTETAYFSSVAQKDAFNELDVEQFEIVATLDSHTSAICQELDGKVFDMKDYESGVTAPPFHVWCRTTTVPFFDDEFNTGERAARDQETGKTYYVPSDTTYPQWKESFVDKGSKDGFKEVDPSDMIKEPKNWAEYDFNEKVFDSKADMIGHLEDQYGIKFSDSKKYPMDKEILGDCVNWMDKFNDYFPDFEKVNPCKIPVIENKAPSRMKNAIGSYSYYNDSSQVVGISLNGSYHSDLPMFADYVNKSVETKWTVKNASVHKTFVHEYGHHVSNSFRRIMKNSSWEHNFITECIEDFKKVESNYTYNTYIGMSDHVSRYSATSESELFAEAFAEYFGGENPRPFASIFGEKLEKLLKGVK